MHNNSITIPKSFVCLCSGSGSNFRAIMEAINENQIRAMPLAVISNKADAGALKIGAEFGIKSISLNNSSAIDRNKHLVEVINDLKPDFIILAGYIKMIPEDLVKSFSGRILNIHPSLLPKHGGHGMYGIKVHESVLNSKDKKSGATVHIVTEEYDKGPIILQGEVDVLENDTPEILAARVLKIEHKLFPEAINKFLSEWHKS